MPRDGYIRELDGAGMDEFPVGRDCVRATESQRHFLLVCGPFGPFTRRLAASLRRAGARCSRMILNGGDIYDWGLSHGLVYRDGLPAFGDWLTRAVHRHGLTDIVTYGDSHPYCVAAAQVAAAQGLKVHVLEQGYFRPFWITLERDGVNGNSGLPKDPDAYRRLAKGLPAPEEEWLPPLTPPAAWKLSFYHFVLLVTAPAFPRFRAPYQYSIVRQALGHARRYLHQRLFRKQHRQNLARAMSGDGPLFLGLLQRPGDSQLRLHSPFADTAEFIDTVVASFAAHASPNARLLFKSHPLDHGVEPHGKSVAASARKYGVGDRVFFADIGDLQAMMKVAAGTVTVNSTAGLSAIEFGLPTLVLGTAIYNLPGLTHSDGLDSFWTAANKPDPTLYDAFRRVVIARTQISGAYAIDLGIDRAVPEVTRRLLSA